MAKPLAKARARDGGKTGAITFSPTQFGLDPVLCAAWLYHEEGLKQEQIAQQFGISRASVFNLLQRASDEGVVQISVDPARMGLHRLAQEVRARTGISECYLLPNKGGNAESLTERVARFGARLLERRLDNSSIIGVAWGRTVMALSKVLTPMDLPGASVVQVTGSSIATYSFSPELCTSNIAMKIGARSVNLHAPGILTTAAMKTALMQEPILQQHFKLLQSCTMLLFGVTQVASENLLNDSGFMSTQILREYVDGGAVGYVAGMFFNAEGRVVRTEVDDRHVGMPREDFLKVPMRICMGGGLEKVEAIRAMLKGGYANVLVTDEDTAQGILAT
jgi:dihydroxyacetone kinase-like protein